MYYRGQPSPDKHDNQHNAKDSMSHFGVSAGGARKRQIKPNSLKEMRMLWHDTRSFERYANQTSASFAGFPVPYAKKQSSSNGAFVFIVQRNAANSRH
jgi:hypothetical protein